LVDIMAAPGTLIPADVYNSKGTSFNINQTLDQNQATDSVSKVGNEPVALQSQGRHGQLPMSGNNNWASDNDKTVTLPAQNAWYDTLSVNAGISAHAPCALTSQVQSDQPSTAGFSNQRGDTKLLPDSQHTEESKRLLSDLNSSRAIGSGKSSGAFKGLDNRNNEFQRRRENVAPVPPRPQNPLVIKNWSAFNDISNNKQYNFPRRNVTDNVASSSQAPWLAAKHYNYNSVECNSRPYAAPIRNYVHWNQWCLTYDYCLYLCRAP
jgi:hypothetical protein